MMLPWLRIKKHAAQHEPIVALKLLNKKGKILTQNLPRHQTELSESLQSFGRWEMYLWEWT